MDSKNRMAAFRGKYKAPKEVPVILFKLINSHF